MALPPVGEELFVKLQVIKITVLLIISVPSGNRLSCKVNMDEIRQ